MQVELTEKGITAARTMAEKVVAENARHNMNNIKDYDERLLHLPPVEGTQKGIMAEMAVLKAAGVLDGWRTNPDARVWEPVIVEDDLATYRKRIHVPDILDLIEVRSINEKRYRDRYVGLTVREKDVTAGVVVVVVHTGFLRLRDTTVWKTPELIGFMPAAEAWDKGTYYPGKGYKVVGLERLDTDLDGLCQFIKEEVDGLDRS